MLEPETFRMSDKFPNSYILYLLTQIASHSFANSSLWVTPSNVSRLFKNKGLYYKLNLTVIISIEPGEYPGHLKSCQGERKRPTFVNKDQYNGQGKVPFSFSIPEIVLLTALLNANLTKLKKLYIMYTVISQRQR